MDEFDDEDWDTEYCEFLSYRICIPIQVLNFQHTMARLREEMMDMVVDTEVTTHIFREFSSRKTRRKNEGLFSYVMRNELRGRLSHLNNKKNAIDIRPVVLKMNDNNFNSKHFGKSKLGKLWDLRKPAGEISHNDPLTKNIQAVHFVFQGEDIKWEQHGDDYVKKHEYVIFQDNDTFWSCQAWDGEYCDYERDIDIPGSHLMSEDEFDVAYDRYITEHKRELESQTIWSDAMNLKDVTTMLSILGSGTDEDFKTEMNEDDLYKYFHVDRMAVQGLGYYRNKNLSYRTSNYY